MIYESSSETPIAVESTGDTSESRGPDRPAREVDRIAATLPSNLSEAEQAVWGDPDLLARIESVLDDPSLAVPLDDNCIES